MPPARKDSKLMASLRTEDIIGAKADTKGMRTVDGSFYRSKERNTIRTDDIEGA